MRDAVGITHNADNNTCGIVRMIFLYLFSINMRSRWDRFSNLSTAVIKIKINTIHLQVVGQKRRNNALTST